MKALLLLLCTILSLTVNAQNYLNPTSTWKEIQGYCSWPTCYTMEYSITLVSDTVIAGKTYNKTYLSGIETKWDWSGTTIISQNPVTAFLDPIREENLKIYRFDIASQKEQLLHNFNLALGDTASSTCSHFQIVEKIDTVQIGNIPRKRFFFKDNQLDYLIEGVGSKQALFITPCDFIGFEGGSTLQCYSQDDQYIQFDTTASCGNITSIGKDISGEYSFEMHPNPVKDELEINLDIPNNKELNLQLFNMQGSKLIEKHLLNGSKNINLDLSNIKQGVYIVVINSPGFRYSKKLIKM